jgi:hypothetical protein
MKHISLIILQIILTLSCGKPCTDVEPEIPGCQNTPYKEEHLVSNLGEVVDYLAFEPGSWWIYQHNRTLEYDTIEVVRTEIDRHTVYGHHPSGIKRWLDQERFLTQMYSTNRKYKDNYMTYSTRLRTPSSIFVVSFDTGIVIILKDFNIASHCFTLPIDKNWGNPSGRISEYTVNNKVFNNIIWFYNNQDLSIPYCDRNKFKISGGDANNSIHYWAKDIGLVELRYYGYYDESNPRDSASWNLIDYNVTKFKK